MTYFRICEGCWGSGRDNTMPDGRCDRCHGEGEIEIEVDDQDEDESEEYPTAPKVSLEKTAMRAYRFGIYDETRGGFWLKSETKFRLGFSTRLDAQKEIDKLLSAGFGNLKIKRFEANREEL